VADSRIAEQKHGMLDHHPALPGKLVCHLEKLLGGCVSTIDTERPFHDSG